MSSYEEKLNRIASILNISVDKLRELVESKILEFDNLITEDVALLLVAKDLGLDPTEIEKIRVRNLRDGIKLDRIEVIIGDIIKETDKSIIRWVYDDTASVRAIFSKNAREIGKSLKQGQKVILRNVTVRKLKKLYITIFSENQIELINETANNKTTPPEIIDNYVLVLKSEDNKSIILDEFLKIRTLNKKLDPGKTYRAIYLSDGTVIYIEPLKGSDDERWAGGENEDERVS